MSGIILRDVRIGRIEREGWVDIDAKLTWVGSPMTTIDHQVVDGYWRFSVSATLWAQTDSPDCYAAGQCIDEVRKLPRAQTLCDLWERWHLNDMRAGCAHQTPAYLPGGGYDLDAVPPCPETGYRFGHAWLLEPIPDDERERIVTVLSQLNP